MKGNFGVHCKNSSPSIVVRNYTMISHFQYPLKSTRSVHLCPPKDTVTGMCVCAYVYMCAFKGKLSTKNTFRYTVFKIICIFFFFFFCLFVFLT